MKHAFAALALLLSTSAHAADVIPCDPFKDGINLTFGSTGAVVGAHWWCKPKDQFGGWIDGRAAAVIGADGGTSFIDLGNKKDTNGLAAKRTKPVTDPAFAAVFAKMQPAIVASLPRGPYETAAKGPSFVAFNGTMMKLNSPTVKAGVRCDCNKRASFNGALMCVVDGDSLFAACSKVAP